MSPEMASLGTPEPAPLGAPELGFCPPPQWGTPKGWSCWWGCDHGVGGPTPNQSPTLQPQVLLKEESLIPRGCEEQGLEVQLGLISPRGLFSTDSYQK